MPDNQPPSQEYHIFDPERQEIRVVVIHPPKRRYWLHALLFLATIFTTLCMGARMQYDFNNNLGLFSQDLDLLAVAVGLAGLASPAAGNSLLCQPAGNPDGA